MGVDIEEVKRRAAELRARSAKPAKAEAPTFDDDLIPDIESTFERTEEDDEIDRILDGIDILDAYRRWCGKMEPQPGRKRESIMVSCPIPGHVDKHPSAWVNLDKQTWMCGACDTGGDAYDIAAYHFGFSVPSYKTDGSFPKLRRRMVEDLGYVVKRTPGGKEYLDPVEVEVEPEPEQEEEGLASVTPMPFLETTEDGSWVSIPWRDLLPDTTTFLHRWMEVTSADDVPEEFYFWLGLQAVGAAAGRDVVFADNDPVYPNLFLCLYGPSGLGKSRATRKLEKLLREALPFNHEDEEPVGTYLMPEPASAESLIDLFSKPIFDPADPKKIIGYAGVRGFLRFDELASLTARASRVGNALKPTLQGFYDGSTEVTTKSRTYGLATARNPFCQVVATTQPRAIRALLSQADADSGFLNRWVFVVGNVKPLHSISTNDLDIDATIRPLKNLLAWSSSGRRITLEGDAAIVFDEFFRAELELHRVTDDEPLMGRTHLLFKKLVLLFAINERTDTPSADLVRRVIQLWPYLRGTYRMLGADVGHDDWSDLREAVLSFVRRHEERHKVSPTKKNIREGIPKSLREIAKRLLPSVLRNLEECGELKVMTTKAANGRTMERYEVQ